MRNILSYKHGTPFTGKEIKEWAEYQVTHKTSHLKQGRWLLNKRIKDERLYCFCSDVYPLYLSDPRRKLPYIARATSLA